MHYEIIFSILNCTKSSSTEFMVIVFAANVLLVKLMKIKVLMKFEQVFI